MNPASSSNSSLKVLRQLGSDAHSEAFLAQVRGFEQPMVVRVVKPELAQNSERMNRFIAEARLLTEVSSPGLLQVRSAGRMKDGQVYVLTEFGGEPLQSGGNLRLEELVELGLPLCGALAALHEAGMVLGALNPHEILLSPRGPMLDASLAPLSRAPGATAATDVRALASLLTSLAGAGDDRNPFESAVRHSLDTAITAAELCSALESVRQRWGGGPRTPGTLGPAEAVVESVSVVETDLCGQTLGSYELQRLLGEGAMGRVYLARHKLIGREAAIKVLKAEHAVHKDLVHRFIQEATAVNAIKNEHIVEVHDFGEELGADGTTRVYCVMEVLHGRPLSDELEQGTMGVQRSCRITEQVTTALGAAHALGVVHRDIKPENIFLHQRDGDPDYVKVLDFGVAKLLKPLASLPTSNTQKGVVIGTPEYMAPEQALGLTSDLRIDLYAVGLVLYELLTGEQPFQGDTFGKLVVQITTRPPPPLPAQTRAGEPIPRGLAKIVARCLEKNPEDRFSSAAELASALEPFASGRPPPDPLGAAELEAIGPSRTPRVVAAFGLALLLGAAGFYALRPPLAEAVVGEKAPVPGPAPVVVAKTVTLVVVSHPSGAKVTRLDSHQLLGVTPLTLQTAGLEGPIALRLELADHQPAERQVVLANNVSLSVELVPQLSEPGGKPAESAPPKSGERR